MSKDVRLKLTKGNKDTNNKISVSFILIFVLKGITRIDYDEISAKIICLSCLFNIPRMGCNVVKG